MLCFVQRSFFLPIKTTTTRKQSVLYETDHRYEALKITLFLTSTAKIMKYGKHMAIRNTSLTFQANKNTVNSSVLRENV